MHFDNSYARLPDIFYERIAPVPVKNPRLIRLNERLAQELDLNLPNDVEELGQLFSGNSLPKGATPIAQAYAGHQFGHFVPQLGDGRAVLLGEIVTKDKHRFDMQLKGAGITRFSRGGDGRSPLGPVLREYIVSEAMHSLGIPTTRALAMVTTGESVRREKVLPGAIFTRIASSHVRVGTFEYFASRNDKEAVRQLADYVIDRHYPDVRQADNPYAALFQAVCHAHAGLLARWMAVGFIHGVMNTDNTTLSGETIDFGPCAFMDHYNPRQVFSSIDHQGRYAYNNQPTIAHWNMACFGNCLAPLFHTDIEEASRIGETVLETFTSTFKQQYQTLLCQKIGFAKPAEEPFSQAKGLLELLHDNHVDFTLAFRSLCDVPLDATRADRFLDLFKDRRSATNWLKNWRQGLEGQPQPLRQAREIMQKANPATGPPL